MTGKMWSVLSVVCVMALVLGLAGIADAGVVEITTATGTNGADAWIRGESGSDDGNPLGYMDSNYGAAPQLHALTISSTTRYRKAYIRFDLAGVTVSNVTHATFTLTTSGDTSAGGTFEVYGLNQSYNSGAGLDGWTESEITWNNSLSTGAYYAGNAAGNTVTDATFVGSFNIPSSTSAGAVRSIDSDDFPSLLTFIQADTDFKVTFVVVCDTDGGATAFGSKENDTYDPPTLTLTTLDPPQPDPGAPIAEPAGLGLLGLALLGLRKRRN